MVLLPPPGRGGRCVSYRPHPCLCLTHFVKKVVKNKSDGLMKAQLMRDCRRVPSKWPGWVCLVVRGHDSRTTVGSLRASGQPIAGPAANRNRSGWPAAVPENTHPSSLLPFSPPSQPRGSHRGPQASGKQPFICPFSLRTGFGASSPLCHPVSLLGSPVKRLGWNPARSVRI